MNKDLRNILIVLLIAFLLRLYLLKYSYFIGNDAYYHYSIIRQAINGGGLNNYSLGYGNPLILEPKGFYYITIIPSYIIGLHNAFLIMPVIFGLVGLVFAYLLIKDLYGKRVGLITIIIMSLLIAHIYRTSVNTYRGDAFFLSLFTITLYYFNKELIKGKGLITGLLLGLTASLWNGYPLGVIIIVSGLIINSTLNYLKGKHTIRNVILSLTIMTTYYLIEQLMLITNVIKPVFFTTHWLTHLLLIYSPALISLTYYYTKRVSKKYVIGFIIITGLTLILLNASVIKFIIVTGLLETNYFYKVGVSELLPPTISFNWIMLSLTYYLMWGGLLIALLRKKNAQRLTYMVWVLITTYLMISYSRYNFIGSLTTSSLTALLLDYVYERNKKIGLVVISVVLVVITATTIINLQSIGPRMNYYWEQALRWLSTQPRGLTLTWWDHGSWVQYYSGFPTITDSVSGQAVDRIKRTAVFLMTNNSDRFTDWNVTYLIVGGDDILYNGAITKIANITGLSINYLPQPSYENGALIIRTSDGYFVITSNSSFFKRFNGDVFNLRKTFIVNNNKTVVMNSQLNQSHNCLVITQYFNWLLNDEACNTNYVNLMYGAGLSGYQLIYRNPFVAIYKVL